METEFINKKGWSIFCRVLPDGSIFIIGYDERDNCIGCCVQEDLVTLGVVMYDLIDKKKTRSFKVSDLFERNEYEDSH